MNKSLVSSCSVILLILAFSLSVSSAALSFIVDVESDSENFISCLQSYSNNATSISQLVFTPSNSSFLPIWESAVKNFRFKKPSTPKPSIILTPIEETQIRTALYCTRKHGYQVRIRCGGHDFEGLSYSADVPFVMIDLSNMRSITVDVAKKTAWVQGGATIGEVYYAISQKTNTLYFPAGVAPGVGVGGHLGGGAYGNLLRKYGLGADNVVDARFMDANGRILDRRSMGEDLFWAIRGGGPSSFGIVLAWKLSLVQVPEKVTYFHVDRTLEEDATAIFHKFQYVAPTTDKDLLIRVEISTKYIGNTTNKTIKMSFEGLYQGTMDKMLPLLDENFPELGVTEEVCEEMSMIQSSVLFGGFSSSTPPEILTNRYAVGHLNSKGKSDFVQKPISIRRLQRMWEKMFENDGSEILIVYPSGGKMDEYPETATPYPHRAGVLYQILNFVHFNGQASDTTPVSRQRISWINSFHELVAPCVSKNPRQAYINNIDLDLGVASDSYEEARVWGECYWKRDNFKKLIRIKATVDPDNFFNHPQSIPVFTKSDSDA